MSLADPWDIIYREKGGRGFGKTEGVRVGRIGASDQAPPHWLHLGQQEE